MSDGDGTMMFERNGWGKAIIMNDVASIYATDNKMNLKPMVCWYLDMGLFETLEIILGEELDIQSGYKKVDK